MPTLALLLCATSALAREQFVQKEGTFKQIVERVTIREERSGAIVAVRSGSPERSADYLFRVRPVDESKVIVQLYWRSMMGDSGEAYTLPLDNDIKAEIARQQVLNALLKEDEQARQAANAKKIAALTNGELTFGMSRVEIERKRGKHYRFGSWQQAASGEMIYPDLRFTLREGRLDDARPAGELSDEEKKIPFADAQTN